MSDFKATARKWGDSIAVIIPKEIAQKEGIRVNDKIHLLISKPIDFSKIWGRFKTDKSTEELIRESKKGWM